MSRTLTLPLTLPLTLTRTRTLTLTLALTLTPTPTLTKERRVQRLKCSGCGVLCEDSAAFQEHCGLGLRLSVALTGS